MLVFKIIAITLISLLNYNLFSQAMVFENFNNEKNENWEFISDQVMGGVSSGDYKILKEEETFFLRMTGNVSLENNGGFIQVRKKISKNKLYPFKTIRINARGNNLDYYVHIRTSFTLLPWQYYQASFSVTKDWKTSNLELDGFKPSGLLLPKKINTKHIVSIALVAFGKKQKVELDVSDIILIN